MALQMSWQLTLLQQQQQQQQQQQRKRKISSSPLGLRNLGNTCYLNSVLQCLTYTPPLANFCLKNQHTNLCNTKNSSSFGGDRKRENCPFCLLEKRIVRSLTIEALIDAPAAIHNCLNLFSDQFRFGRQEDAHEFLRFVIDACHNTCLRLNNPANLPATRREGGGGGDDDSSVVKEIFGGALQSQVKCLSCGFESNKTDDIMDISLDLHHNSNSLKDAMQRFFQPEVLDGSNKYKCDKCKKLVTARKQMSILQAPNILVIQLKRFDGVLGGKIDRAIAFAEILVLSGYMSKESQDPRPEYNLFGSIVHSGYSPDSGHYYAYVKDAVGRWFCCNDSLVSPSTLQEVLSEKVYILFYSRTNQRPKTTKASTTNGVKPPACIGNDASPSAKAIPSLKTVTSKPYQAHHLDKDRPMVIKNSKPPSSPRIKFGILKTLDSNKVHANGNGNGNAHKPGSVESHNCLKESTDRVKLKEDMAAETNNNGTDENRSPDAPCHRGKDASLVPHGNGSNGTTKGVTVKTVKTEGNVHNGTAFTALCHRGKEASLVSHGNGSNGKIKGVDVRPVKTEGNVHNGTGPMAGYRVHESNHILDNGREDCSDKIAVSKRKSLNGESEDMVKENPYWANDEQFKEALAKDASSLLLSCGWCDEVRSFMRAKKKLCAQHNGVTTSNSELKKMLIAEAKPTFITQIPEVLKERLIERLKSVSQGRQNFDT